MPTKKDRSQKPRERQKKDQGIKEPRKDEQPRPDVDRRGGNPRN